MRYLLTLALLTAVASLHAADTKPLRALLVCGGCCHDYAAQQKILSSGISARANVVVDVIHSEDRGTSPQFPLYENADWSKGYDVIIHDECAAGIKDEALVKNILNAHKTVPAINLHCAMHSYHVGPDDWSKYLGLKSASHGPQEPIALNFVDTKHPITETLSNWTTIKEELYNNITVFDAHPLIMGKQTVKEKDGTTKDVEYIVAWTNETQGARTFSTTIGHNNETVGDARYLDLVTRGLLWACNKLNAEYLTPYKGEAGKFTNLPATKKEEPKAVAAPVAPKDASGVTVTASSEESGKGNYAWKAVDNDPNTRWCASSPDQPQWLQLELEKPATLSGIKISWESSNNAYKHKVEGSTDGKTWTTLADASSNDKGGDNDHAVSAKDIRFVKITCNGSTQGGWASIREVSLKGDGIKAMAPKVAAAQKAEAKKADDKAADPYAKEGNIKPEIVKLTPEQEADILKDVKVPDGFDLTLFANPKAANYPVYVAAAPNGDLYVSSDGNGSLGRNPNRGRIIRLRDNDGDGRADETKVFCEVDSPRGLVWDNDRLYVVHPPDVSVYIDKDGDGVSDEEKTLIKGVAFGFADRPADHTTNGLSIGVDGWLYIAGGDFGYMDAVGTDGRHLQHRGGGVTRFRPDGSGLEIYSKGTRNILEVAVGPLMNIFARDNTNDGGGWDIRLHNFTGLEHHGYPYLYKNFHDEHIQPLADYGGGSGCGAMYLDEPGFGKWNNAPLTCDWGTGALWYQPVAAQGASYVETAKPEKFVGMTRPTDADVDAQSRLYQASWKGATFNWEGPDVGYIVRVTPKDFKAPAVPNFNKVTDAELVKLLESESHRTRLEAQRTLLRRESSATTTKALLALAGDKSKPLVSRVASLYAVTQRNSADQIKPVSELAADASLQPYVLRALSDSKSSVPVEIYAAGLKSSDARIRLEAVIGVTHLKLTVLEPQIAAVLGDSDLVVAHTAFRCLGQLNAHAACFTVLDNYDAPAAQRTGAVRALQLMHTPEAVDGLIQRLAKDTGTESRKGLLSALCRLHFTDGEWKGDSWGTRPDTRGPYYQPEAWSETPKIAEALKATLSKATPEEAAFLVSELNRNRIQFNEALERILTLAAKDDKLIPDAVSQMSTAETVPVAGIPLLVKAAQLTDASPAVLAQAITALAKTDSADGCRASLTALVTLSKATGSGKEQDAARNAFLGAPKLENFHQLLEVEAEKVGTPTAAWADAALLTLSARKTGSPESIELSGKALEAGWQNPQRRIQILKAAGDIKHNPYASKIIAALDDADPEVAKIAKQVAGKMKLEKKTKDSGPLISTMKVEDVIAQVIKTKGDVALGEQLFTRQTCVACHTVSQDQPPKGPYLGNIAQTYKRPDLAQNILDPNKTIAQGFVSEVFVHKDGTTQLGFVTFESADTVKFRNITAQEFTYAVKDITKRDKLPISIMPPGLVATLTVKEFASLLDYLESLSKK
ncbi:hypothetical protein BH11VER1_BH11VER1_15650 [soil metagenome]